MLLGPSWFSELTAEKTVTHIFVEVQDRFGLVAQSLGLALECGAKGPGQEREGRRTWGEQEISEHFCR